MFHHQDQCLWSQSTAASVTSWTSFATRQRRLSTLLWIFPTSWRTQMTTKTSAISKSLLEGTMLKCEVCSWKSAIYVTCVCWHLSLSISLFFPSDSGISSTSSSMYLEMRPSQQTNMESSRGKKLSHPALCLTQHKCCHCAAACVWKASASFTSSVINFIPIWFSPRLFVRGDGWLAAGHWRLAEVFLSGCSGPWLSGCQKRE